MQSSFICILLTPSKPFFSVEQTMIYPSICCEVKYSARPQGGQKRPSGTFLAGRSGRRKACPLRTVETPGFTFRSAWHHDDRMYVMCAPHLHGAKVRARGLVTHTLGAISPLPSASFEVQPMTGAFLCRRPPKAKGYRQAVRPRHRKKSEKKFAGRLTLPFGMV